MNRRAMARLRDSDAGFTLIELVICVGMVGIVAAALTGIMISELRNDVTTAARMDESFDVQFATTYWQRDVSSIGLRETTPVKPAANPYSLVYATKQSVFTDGSNACDLSGVGGTPAQRTAIVTLAWSEYDPSAIPSVTGPTDANGDGIPDDNAPRVPHDVKVTWATRAAPSGGAPYELWRVRCGTNPAAMRIADHLATQPTVACVPAACTGTTPPRTITLHIEARAERSTSSYTADLSGERRQS